LIDLGVAINVMIKEKMEKIQLTGLHPTLIVLQLADRSTVKLEGILEYVMVFVDS